MHISECAIKFSMRSLCKCPSIWELACCLSACTACSTSFICEVSSAHTFAACMLTAVCSIPTARCRNLLISGCYYCSVDSADANCPLCIEILDLTDMALVPCKCGYRVCLFCFSSLKACPHCRANYGKQLPASQKDERKRIQEDLPDDNRIVGQEKRGVFLLVNR